jgi:hypothetical protein
MVSKSFPVEIAKILPIPAHFNDLSCLRERDDVGQAMVRGGHRNDLRDFAHFGQPR